MQMNPKEQINNLSKIFSDGLEDIISASKQGRNIGLINSFYHRKKQTRSREELDAYNNIRKFIEENVLNYQYRLILINKITFLFKYGKIDCLKDDGNVIEIIGSVIGDLKESSVYTLGFNIDGEKIVVNSMDGTEDESISNIIEITYKTAPQDDISEYIKDVNIRTKNYVDVDSPYEDRNITEKFLALKKEDDKVITVLKRRNIENTTTLLCSNYQDFKDNRVIKEEKKSVTEWNGTGINKGYIIGSYKGSYFSIEQASEKKKEEYFYAARNNSPTFCDIIADFLKIQLSPVEFDVATRGDNLVKIIPIFYKINEAENEYTFGNSGTLKRIALTKKFL